MGRDHRFAGRRPPRPEQLVRLEYRRLPFSDVWHFHPDCQHYRRLGEQTAAGYGQDIFVRKTKPTTGELCNECQARARRATETIRDGRL